MYTRITKLEQEVVRQSSIIETTPEGLTHWRTPLGEFYNRKANVPFLVAEQMAGSYDVGSCVIRKDDVVIDCGANIGTFTRRALNQGAKLVVSVEVDPRNVVCLRKTFAKEIEEHRVIIVDKGVWDKDDSLTMNLFEDSALSSLVMKDRSETKETPKTVQVPLTTLDKIVAELQLTNVNYIKMDVEGAERQALRGAEATIRKFRPRLSIATENLADDIAAVPAVINSFGLGYLQKNGSCRIIQQPFVMRPEVICFSQP